jgi:WD40 repeat protein
MNESKRYWAFISYSHTDRAWADWLHKALERYRLPRSLLSKHNRESRLPAHLTPVFLDRVELAAGVDLEKPIIDALTASHSLVVVCSPSAVQSVRVAQEIEIFRRSTDGRVLSLIVAGRPNARDRGVDASEECFPAALKQISSTDDQRQMVPLAADGRPGKGGRQEALLKLVAGILDVNLDQLRQRDLQRRRMRWAISSITLACVMIGAFGLAFFAWTQRTVALTAQAHLLTQSAYERSREGNFPSAQAIILNVMQKNRLETDEDTYSTTVFQEIRGADPLLAVLGGHTDRLFYAEFSPDGHQIATASFDHTARLWDSQTGALLGSLRGHSKGIYSLRYSPDGSQLVTAAYDWTARLWNTAKRSETAVLRGHTAPLRTARFSGDGRYVVTASLDKTARVWDATTGAPVAVLLGHTDELATAVFSPNGKHVLTASADHTARVWNSSSGELLLTLAGHADRVTAASYSPDGGYIVTTSDDHTARIWNATTGAMVTVLSGHSNTVRAASYSPDGSHLITTSQDQTARIWDARTYGLVSVLRGHNGWVISARYSPDGSTVTTTSADATARMWDAATGAPLAVFRGHGDHVISSAYSPDGQQLLTASEDRTARLWLIAPKGFLRTLSEGRVAFTSATYSPDGAHVLVSSQDKTARVFDALSGALLTTLNGHRQPINSAVYSPDGTRILTASRDATARIWDARTGSPILTIPGQLVVEYSSFSPDGSRVVTASQDKTARTWSAQDASPFATLIGHDDRVIMAAYSPLGDRIVTSSFDHTARIWDSTTGALLTVLTGHTLPVNSARYSPDSGRVVTASEDKTMRVWDVATGNCIAILSGHRAGVTSAEYSRDGTHILSASADGTARIWDAKSHKPLDVLFGHTQTVNSAVYSPDGNRILTASDDATAREWSTPDKADLLHQIAWYQAAQFDPMSEVDRAQLGLSTRQSSRSWSNATECDRAAGAFYDPDRRSVGKSQMAIFPTVAESACSKDIERRGNEAILLYEQGRALIAKHQLKDAQHALKRALSENYPAAAIDLADLLLDPSFGAADPERAVSLYETAWRKGVAIAAYKLGQFYESDTRMIASSLKPTIPPNESKSWFWYRQGASHNEPNALARFAERDETQALTEPDQDRRHALLLQAFSHYAAAVETARNEDWPDDAWRNWRYRRATLARILAREGMTQQVADAYQLVAGR